MPVLLQHRIYRSDLQNNPDVLYLFGDNLQRKGYGGQAGEMRGEPNAVGVATKRRPDMMTSTFFTDSDVQEFHHIVLKDLKRAVAHLNNGGTVVIPSDGLGTGLSELPQRAQSCNAILVVVLESLKTIKWECGCEVPCRA